jgi:predicted PurR-regulated permease PerM
MPVIIWAWTAMDSGWVMILTPSPIDNVLKPILITHGPSTPMLVILVGVIGGTLSDGLIGLFLGPIVLGVFYDLLGLG